MNINLKLIVVTAASFVSGYLVANRLNDSYYHKQAQEMVDEVREEYEDKLAQAREAAKESDADTDALVRDASLVMQAYQGKSESESGGFEPVDVHAIAERPDSPAKVQYSTYSAKEAEKQQPRDVQPENIDVITAEQYAEGMDDYDQPTFVYHHGDKVLASGLATEGMVDDDLRALMLGSRSDLIDREGFWESLNGDAFYLRNHDLKIDVEIIRADEDLKYFDETKNPGDNG